MEEQILVSSEHYNLKKAFCIIIIAALVLSVALFIHWTVYDYTDHVRDYGYEIERISKYQEEYLEHQAKGSCYLFSFSSEECIDCHMYKSALEIREKYPTKEAYAISGVLEGGRFLDMSMCPVVMVLFLCMVPGIVITIIMGLIFLWLRSYQLTVTDKRIYGTVIWGRRVDLPVDSVSATAAIPLLKGVSVATSSGRISFLAIKNANEIYKVVSSLLIERQPEKNSATIVATVPKSDEADQLRKYKDLLDSGVITQEEFEAKKKQLLGL